MATKIFKFLILSMAFTSLSAHAYNYQKECVDERAWLESALEEAESNEALAEFKFLEFSSLWKTVFHWSSSDKQIDDDASSLRFWALLGTQSTHRGALEWIREKYNKLEVKNGLNAVGNKYEYDILRQNLTYAKAELLTLAMLKVDCDFFPLAFQTGYRHGEFAKHDVARDTQRELDKDRMVFSKIQYGRGYAHGILKRADKLERDFIDPK